MPTAAFGRSPPRRIALPTPLKVPLVGERCGMGAGRHANRRPKFWIIGGFHPQPSIGRQFDQPEIVVEVIQHEVDDL
jgi:hypothetical protein